MEGAFNPDPPDQVVKLIFISYSSGENWLRQEAKWIFQSVCPSCSRSVKISLSMAMNPMLVKMEQALQVPVVKLERVLQALLALAKMEWALQVLEVPVKPERVLLRGAAFESGGEFFAAYGAAMAGTQKAIG